MSKSQRSFFLLEIIFSIVLAAILLCLLFRFLVSYAITEKRIETAQMVLLEEQRMQEKLESIFTSIEPRGAEDPSFYAVAFPEEGSVSLVVLYNAGVDPDPAFSGPNTCRIYLNEKGEFCLTQWPHASQRTESDYRTEVLLKNVRAFDWELFGHKEGSDEKTWLSHWPKKQGGVPSIIRLKLWCGIDKKKNSGPNLQFAFILPNQEPIQVLK